MSSDHVGPLLTHTQPPTARHHRLVSVLRTSPDRPGQREATRKSTQPTNITAISRPPIARQPPASDLRPERTERPLARLSVPSVRQPGLPSARRRRAANNRTVSLSGARIEHPLPEKSRSTNVHASPVLTLGRKTDASAPIPPHAPPDPLHNLTRHPNLTRAIRASYASAPRAQPSASPRPEQNERSRPRIPRRRPLFFLRLPDV